MSKTRGSIITFSLASVFASSLLVSTPSSELFSILSSNELDRSPGISSSSKAAYCSWIPVCMGIHMCPCIAKWSAPISFISKGDWLS